MAVLFVLLLWGGITPLSKLARGIRTWGLIILFLCAGAFEAYYFWYVCASRKGLVSSVDLSHQSLVSKPAEDYPGVYWVDLGNAHLEGANLVGSVLKKADLHRAQLKNANLAEAVLQGADLWQTNFEGANLNCADLNGALLSEANFEGANLAGAKLKSARYPSARQLIKAKSLYGAEIDPKTLEAMQKDPRWNAVNRASPGDRYCYNFDQ